MSERIELILDTFKKENNERLLFSFWKHFPYYDLDSEKLAQAHITYYNRHQFDLMKISLHGRYPCLDFGCTLSNEYDPITGSSRCEKTPFTNIDAWKTLEPVDVGEGEFGKQLKAVKLIHKSLEPLPKMNTIFSPLMVASKLDENVERRIKENPETMYEALSILTDVMLEFARASIDAGSQGLFIASQHLRKTDLSWKNVKKFEIHFLNKMLRILNRKAEFTVLHIHGQDIFFEKADKEINVDAFNWHDKTAGPSLEKANNMTSKGFLAGIDEDSLLESTVHEIDELINNTLHIPNVHQRVILSPGCVIPIEVENEKLDILHSAILKYNKHIRG